jgi:hypothetical protein
MLLDGFEHRAQVYVDTGGAAQRLSDQRGGTRLRTFNTIMCLPSWWSLRTKHVSIELHSNTERQKL